MSVSESMEISEWQEWFIKCKNAVILIKAYMNLDLDANLTKDPEFEALWEKVILVKFYIEHICYNEEFLFNRCIVLWNFFKEKTNFKKYETFQLFTKILKSINNMLKKQKIKDAEKCTGCSSNMYESLFVLNNKKCKCSICEKCLEEVKATKKCPGCSEESSNLSNLQKLRDNPFVDEFNKFKTNLNCLYMDVVSNLCFDGSILPEKEVINAIINDLMPKTKVEQSENKDDQLFDLNLSPSIKSTLFQLLLNYKQEEIEEHLNSILSKSANYVKVNYSTSDILNVKLMYLNSIEDQFYSKGLDSDNLNFDIELGISFLDDLLANFTPSVNSSVISELKTIAKIKFCLITCSKLVFECDYINQMHTRFIQMTQTFIGNNNNCLWFRFFLIKHIFRRYGKEESLKSTKLEMFSWILPQYLLQSSVDVS